MAYTLRIFYCKVRTETFFPDAPPAFINLLQYSNYFFPLSSFVLPSDAIALSGIDVSKSTFSISFFSFLAARWGILHFL